MLPATSEALPPPAGKLPPVGLCPAPGCLALLVLGAVRHADHGKNAPLDVAPAKNNVRVDLQPCEKARRVGGFPAGTAQRPALGVGVGFPVLDLQPPVEEVVIPSRRSVR